MTWSGPVCFGGLCSTAACIRTVRCRRPFNVRCCALPSWLRTPKNMSIAPSMPSPTCVSEGIVDAERERVLALLQLEEPPEPSQVH